jgi:hypothetical protein
MNKKLGRPRKKKGVTPFMNFQRIGLVMHWYDEERTNGQKHSAAVAQTVELIKQNHPMMRISQAEVKRILAALRPRGSHTILRFEGSTVRGEELAKHYRIEAQPAAVFQNKGSKLPAPADDILPKSVTIYRTYCSERPNYPRHNRKPPKE